MDIAVQVPVHQRQGCDGQTPSFQQAASGQSWAEEQPQTHGAFGELGNQLRGAAESHHRGCKQSGAHQQRARQKCTRPEQVRGFKTFL